MDTNVLWITGVSGSGKSTLANELAAENGADIIYLDLYTFDDPDDWEADMSKDFNQYLDVNLPGWRDMQRAAAGGGSAAGMWFDTLENAIKDYGTRLYGRRKVIAEGVQLLDETLFYNNKQALRNQPVIIMTTPFDSITKDIQDPKRYDQLRRSESDRDTLLGIFEDKVP